VSRRLRGHDLPAATEEKHSSNSRFGRGSRCGRGTGRGSKMGTSTLGS